MITLGIDLSSAKEGTAACVIEWRRGRALTRKPELRCKDEKLDELIAQADVVGIDAPFGWPVAFVEAVAGWSEIEWSDAIRRKLQFRETDRYVVQTLKIWPLSVSTDRIGLPAMRAMALLERHKVKDKSGGAKFYEVYPAASLKSWGLTCRGYKLIDPKCRQIRQKILRDLRNKMPWLDFSDEYVESSDALDALVASLTARAAATELTMKPNRDQATAARREGWIHFSQELPTL